MQDARMIAHGNKYYLNPLNEYLLSQKQQIYLRSQMKSHILPQPVDSASIYK